MELSKTRCNDCGHLNRYYEFKYPNTDEKRAWNRANAKSCVRCGSENVRNVEDGETMGPYSARAMVIADAVKKGTS